jgi:hypothetical protein
MAPFVTFEAPFEAPFVALLAGFRAAAGFFAVLEAAVLLAVRWTGAEATEAAGILTVYVW